MNKQTILNFKRWYEKNEDQNYHTENVVLLAEIFGDADDVKKAKQVLERHHKERGMTKANSKDRDELHDKLMPKAMREMSKYKVKFAKGGSFATVGSSIKGGFRIHNLQNGDKVIYKKNNKELNVSSVGADHLYAFDKFGKQYKITSIAEIKPSKELEKRLGIYAHGGMTEHGLKEGDYINSGGRGWGDQVEGYNKKRGEYFLTDLDKGKREVSKDGMYYTVDMKMAKGGMTEHGLKVNDTIKSGGGIRNTTIRVHNSNFGDARVDLDKGKRTPLKFNSKTKKYEEKMAKGGKTKKGKKEPMVVRSYFEDEAIDYGSGGAIYKGDRVKIKDTNKSMVVKNIQKGKKGYVEFSGDKGTYLKGDLKKYEKGGMTSGWCYSIGGL